MHPSDILPESMLLTYQQVGTDEYQKLAAESLKLCGTEIEPHLKDDDSPGLFAPVMFDRDGKELPGCILTLEDRAIFAWIKGTFRVKNFERVVPYDTIRQVEVTKKSASRLSVALDALEVTADDRWTAIFPNVYGEDSILPALLRDVLIGATTAPRVDPQAE